MATFNGYLSLVIFLLKMFYADESMFSQAQQVCPISMDTVFLLDGSSSIGQSDFDKMKEFIISVLEHFRISEKESHVGVVHYSDSPSTKVFLTDVQNTSSIYTKIRAMPFIGGNTHTDLGLNESRYLFLDGSRLNVPRVLIVITDGESNGDSVVVDSNLLRDDGVFVLALGVGPRVSTVELRQMATTFDHVYQFTSADQVQSQKAKIASAICAVTRKPQLYFTLVTNNSVMVGHVITSSHVIDDVACAFKCLNNEQCFSFDFMSASNTCQLNYSTKQATPDDVISDDESIHYDMTFSLQ
ncbi:collagen alpha-6(VI) chain-like [Actinia tenebrosa]|uniref:Collagen alpha-6(VI) chain-like n=1 Tax=Actinia tenebrosa TaxID=6105 RepID=A0A6P8J0W4_ACTTE|nr:collagen alpha-6(VI) chain-like [Actinia tenebrosa]